MGCICEETIVDLLGVDKGGIIYESPCGQKSRKKWLKRDTFPTALDNDQGEVVWVKGLDLR